MALSKAQRRKGVEEAFASLRLDGLQPSPAAREDADDYIEGHRSLDEIIEDAIARHTRH